MHLVHTTKDGARMFIAQMADSHLQNTINQTLRQIETGMDMGNARAAISPQQAVIFGIDIERVQRAAKGLVPQGLTRLYPYLAEAFLRWGDAAQDASTPTEENLSAEFMEEVLARLRVITGRNSKMEPLGLTSALPPGVKIKALPHSNAGDDYEDPEYAGVDGGW